ncbi:ABC transporter permease [Paractinoplanes ferrugineus]|uniref:ABC transporter permease n=1 Tax=Paractinoplanes ferrugineus TaxID=113564 RepID=A0A919J042_9ACTN|nr:ABC transporter permease [Actinoplanes ferrugineus]GIE10483.1 ABC transporter permease [Actinoplanes ferrugineus]
MTAIALPAVRTKRRRSRRLPVSARIAAGVIGLVVVAVLLAPVLAPHNPTQGQLGERLAGIGTAGHLLGTDGQGRDILSRLLYGGRLSLLSGLIPVLVAAVIGTLLGLLAGLGNRFTNGAVMRTLDVFYAFPAVLLAIAIAAALGSGASNAIVALSVILIPPIARIAETETARLRGADFMEAARASGARTSSIAIRQVLPNIAPAIVVYCTALIGLCIVYSAGLSYLGLGIAPPAPEWGVMISDLQQYTFTKPELLLMPALAILVASVAFNVLGDGLGSYFNVRQEVR